MFSLPQVKNEFDLLYKEVFEELDNQAQHDFGERYTETHAWRIIADMLLLPPVSSRDRVLEIGPSAAGVLLKRMTGARVEALCIDDLNRNFLDPAGIPLHLCDLVSEPPPIEEGSVDLVLFCEVLEHFTRHPGAALRNIVNIVKPGGRIFFSVPNFASVQKRLALLAGKNPQDMLSKTVPYYAHLREPTLDEALRWWREAGACVHRTGYTDYDHRDFQGSRLRQLGQCVRHADWLRFMRVMFPPLRQYFYIYLCRPQARAPGA
jgi:SAM-dependent methyltransferase